MRQPAIARLEAGEHEPSLATHARPAQGLGIDFSIEITPTGLLSTPLGNTGALASPYTAGHTGFTGTSFMLDQCARAVGVLLTNRVHPFRDHGTVTASRIAVAKALIQ